MRSRAEPMTDQHITDFHAKCFAYELTKRCASDSVEKLASVLADAQVDLNPHQVEAGLLLAQEWADDRHASRKAELTELDEALKEAKKLARFAPTLPETLERQRAARTLEGKREEAWRAYDEARREIERQKDALLDEISRRLEQRIEEESVFLLRWKVE